MLYIFQIYDNRQIQNFIKFTDLLKLENMIELGIVQLENMGTIVALLHKFYKLCDNMWVKDGYDVYEDRIVQNRGEYIHFHNVKINWHTLKRCKKIATKKYENFNKFDGKKIVEMLKVKILI